MNQLVFSFLCYFLLIFSFKLGLLLNLQICSVFPSGVWCSSGVHRPVIQHDPDRFEACPRAWHRPWPGVLWNCRCHQARLCATVIWCYLQSWYHPPHRRQTLPLQTVLCKCLCVRACMHVCVHVCVCVCVCVCLLKFTNWQIDLFYFHTDFFYFCLVWTSFILYVHTQKLTFDLHNPKPWPKIDISFCPSVMPWKYREKSILILKGCAFVEI